MIIIDKKNTGRNAAIAAAIGFFDGVHIGHRYLIQQARDVAALRNLSSAVISFPTHPRKTLHSEYKPALLCGYEEKLERLASTGLDYCISLDFTVAISRMPAKEFMQKILKERLNVNTLLIGYDHRFGHNRSEGFDEYQQYGSEIGIDVIQANQLPGEHVSSTRIRTLLNEGKVEDVSRMLSYNYSISGKVIEGFQVGRTIGFPTANIEVWERYKVVPALGVYAVYAHVDNVRYNAMLYIGTRPTIHNDGRISLEVNLFNFNNDIYGKDLNVEFIEFIRHDKKFETINSLKAQIMKDKESAISILKNKNC